MLKQAYIYNTDDFWNKWELLMKEVDKMLTVQGGNFNPKTYNNTLAAAILAYRGLTRAQIVAIKNQDVTADGLTGYDVTFDDRSLQFLLDCKVYTDKNQPFIWTSKTAEIKEQTISDFFSKKRIGDSDIAAMFNPISLAEAYKFGKLTEFCEGLGMPITGTSRAELTPFRPYYPDICKILGITYIPQNSSAMTRVLHKYLAGYLLPLQEAKSNEAKPVVAQDAGADQNQELFKKALLDKIAVMEKSLAEIKAMVEFLS